MNLRMPAAKLACIALAAFAMQLASPAQSALEKRNEAGLAQAEQQLKNAQTDGARLAALNEKSLALARLGRSAEALDVIRQAEALAPDDLGAQVNKAIILDSNEEHQAARALYDSLLGKFQEWRGERAKSIRKGEKPAKSDGDAGMRAISTDAPMHSALNYALLGNHNKALAQLTRDFEIQPRISMLSKDGDYATLWRLWLTAKSRSVDGLRPDTAITTLIQTANVSTPYHEEMLRLWWGKGHWQRILAAINGMKISDEEKETFLTEAHFFAAGYYRYMKRDTETALELLNAENARPFNGCIERLFIRKEIGELKK